MADSKSSGDSKQSKATETTKLIEEFAKIEWQSFGPWPTGLSTWRSTLYTASEKLLQTAAAEGADLKELAAAVGVHHFMQSSFRQVGGRCKRVKTRAVRRSI